MRKVLLIFVILVLFLLTPLSNLACAESKPIVTTTTTVLASIVKDLAGDKVYVDIVASPAVCPAHYDVKPSDVDKFRRASLILYHGFEPWVKSLKEASGTKAPLVKISGPWNTPDNLKKLYVSVADALKEYLGIDVSSRLNKCLKSIDNVAKWLKDFAEKNGFINTPVVVMLWQKAFISYLGFKIVAVYRPPERITPKEYQSVIENASKYNARLVIDNLQSGSDLGVKIAEEIGAVEVALSNFPGTALGLNNVTEVMKYNARLLAEALKYYRWKSSAIEVGELYEEINSMQAEIKLWKYSFIASIILNVILIIVVAIQMRRLSRK